MLEDLAETSMYIKEMDNMVILCSLLAKPELLNIV